MDDDGPDVADLVARAVRGDEAAWNELVDRYTPLLVRVVQGYRLGVAELEDVAQTVWVRLIEQLAELREPRALPAWIVTTARREALRSARRSDRVKPQDPLDDAWSARFASQDDDPDDALEQAARHLALLEGFALLSPRQRELLTLLAQDPPPAYAEINRRTGIPVGAIGPTRKRALDRLRRTPSVQALLAVGTGSSASTEPSGRA